MYNIHSFVVHNSVNMSDYNPEFDYNSFIEDPTLVGNTDMGSGDLCFEDKIHYERLWTDRLKKDNCLWFKGMPKEDMGGFTDLEIVKK